MKKKSKRSESSVTLEMHEIELELYRLKLHITNKLYTEVVNQGNKITIERYLALLATL